MEPILIPSVPREAFNKHRPISDLVRKQVEHFKHIESRLPPEVRAKLPQHEIVTEDDASRYIGPITAYLLSRPVPAAPAAKKIVPIKPPPAVRRSPPLALAASAAPAGRKSGSKKKSAAKKETPKAKKSPSAKPKPKKALSKRKK
jgi:hypothetical protein